MARSRTRSIGAPGSRFRASTPGPNAGPDPAQFKGLDAVLFDIQDIGCRFYTYISTMGLCMDAAAEAGVKFIVLDRVNPIGGTAVEGPIHVGKRTFTGHHNLPVRHGMTVGELAKMFQAELYPETTARGHCGEKLGAQILLRRDRITVDQPPRPTSATWSRRSSTRAWVC